MYNQTPLITYLPSEESDFELLAHPGWKAEMIPLKRSKQCARCFTSLLKGSKAVVLSMIDPEAHIAKNGGTKENAYRTIVYCSVSCNRAAQFNIKANQSKWRK
ncbi:MAG: hypothetical protein UW75_C0023G0003 [Parcubacteria group bacterium GW2011_GWF2_44_8]|nr:MAG: hypothetical protein UW75_C0023G0003 [Parcubacteria group bacterium GW2011_GWF2_44_8]